MGLTQITADIVILLDLKGMVNRMGRMHQAVKQAVAMTMDVQCLDQFYAFLTFGLSSFTFSVRYPIVTAAMHQSSRDCFHTATTLKWHYLSSAN